MEAQLLQPVIALIIWTLVMWAWMLTTRVRAIIALKMKLDACAPRGEQMSKLPAKVRWKADNYNHLLEQPILFYVIVFCLVTLGTINTVSVYAAWTYVVLRVLHSLVQVLNNNIEKRFAVFVLSNIPLAILSFNAAAKAFS